VPFLRARLRFVAEMVAALLFILMFAAFLLQVFTRYVLNDPITWTQEVVLIVYIWIVFWCAAFLIREREHIRFDMIAASLAPGRQRILEIVLSIITLVAFAAALPGTLDYVTFMRIEKSPILGIRFDIIYAIFVLFVASVVVAAAMRLIRLFGSGWRKELDSGGEVLP
jgi:TRAP-type C4-dicarboxylate transport system permease small subunit